MKQLRTLLLLLLLPLGLFAQDECTSSTAITYLHGNEIRAAINNNGALFNEGGGDGAFLRRTTEPQPPVLFSPLDSG